MVSHVLDSWGFERRVSALVLQCFTVVVDFGVIFPVHLHVNDLPVSLGAHATREIPHSCDVRKKNHSTMPHHCLSFTGHTVAHKSSTEYTLSYSCDDSPAAGSVICFWCCPPPQEALQRLEEHSHQVLEHNRGAYEHRVKSLERWQVIVHAAPSFLSLSAFCGYPCVGALL